MSYLPPLPLELQQVEYVKIYFHLQIKEYFELPQWGLLQLRREFLQAIRTLDEWGSTTEANQLKKVLQPPLSNDPHVRRQAQKPAPAFVISCAPEQYGLFEPGQSIVLPVLFLGSGVLVVNAFVAMLQQLGQQGLYHGTGRFLLEAVESEDATGTRLMHWTGGEQSDFSAPLCDLYWFLERQQRLDEKLTLDVVSPLRLLHQQKPLFKVTFAELFRFVLRRVSSMLASHSGVEIIDNAQYYLDHAERVEVLGDRLKWQDWRSLRGEHRHQDFGGLLGSMELSGESSAELFWVLQLGSLLQIGKGSSYGAGQYRLRTHC